MLSLFNFVHIFLIFKLRNKLEQAWLRVGGLSILIGRSYYCWFFHGMSCCGYGKIMAHWTGGMPRVFGVILMVRSTRGLKLLDKTVKPRGFWRFYGEISLWVCVFSMLLVGLLMVIAFITALFSPPQTPPPSASELVAIPGLNPVIPLGWGALAFIVALVIRIRPRLAS